jgi:molybdopterin/thiamine biosynthesis adenylyltransferase
VTITGINKKVTSKNIDALVSESDIIIDGTDNIPLRLLINKTAIQHKIPWVYAGVYETIGMVMAILPKKTACFRCISPNISILKKKEIPVLGSLPASIAAIQCNETIKVLVGKPPAGFLIYDTWNQCFDRVEVKRNPYCTVCGKK